jgi:hypothetical protein
LQYKDAQYRGYPLTAAIPNMTIDEYLNAVVLEQSVEASGIVLIALPHALRITVAVTILTLRDQKSVHCARKT